MVKTLQVSAIENGTVIDHIPSKNVIKLMKILDLNGDKMVTIGMNLPSKRLGKKGIIKISGRDLTKRELRKIGIVAKGAKVNTIKHYDVVEKTIIELHEVPINVVKCKNPKCITNNEDVPTRFEILKKEPLKLHCHYCERMIQEDEIQIK